MKAYDIITLDPATKIVDSSKIKDFIMCERYYFFKHVLGWQPDAPNNHLSFGSAWHEAMEHLLLNDYSPASIMAAYQLLLKRYREDFLPDTDELFTPKTPDNALIVLIEYCKRYLTDKFKVHHTEIGGKVALDETRSIYFKMDSICEGPDGKIFSLEHKTGSSDYMWEHQWPLAIQPGTYSHVLYCLYPFERVDGIYMNAAFFKKAKKGWAELQAGKPLSVLPPFDFLRLQVKKSPAQMNAWHQNLLHHVHMLEWNMEMLADCSDSDAVMNAFHCRSDNCSHYGRLCEFHDFCTTWTNPLQRAHTVPIGFKREFWDPTAEPCKTEIQVNEGGEVSVKGKETCATNVHPDPTTHGNES
jgi:hypothetical protein